MKRSQTIQLGEICQRLEIRERDARYVLEQGHVPKGVDLSPESGNHRQFSARQAFWLGMVLKLKQFGLVAPLAVKIANYAEQSLRTVTQNLSWEWTFDPSRGQFDTEHQYFVELAAVGAEGPDHIRFGADANPSRDGLDYFDWHRITQPGKPVKGLRPCVVLRLDLSQIAQALSGAFDAMDA